ncbi:AEC family transporter [Vibrio mytili]|uniref:Membrane protein n=1 Tax=Vibrio mytili TaxID=50718 RepID=A0A0C3E4S2_9VIBR|nr:AEC family transporter [Vibrio mytili]KIN09368.1 membrane protein [Vibrio mytili]
MIHQVISILFPVFALVGVGYLVGRYIKPDFRPINRINMEVFTPALVFSSLVSMPLNSNQGPLLLAAIVAVVVPGLVMLPVCKITGLSFKSWAPPHMFRNSGNLAIPLFTYTFGDVALSSAVMLFVVSGCLHVSLGVSILSNGNPFKQMIKMPIFLSASLAMALNLSGFGAWGPLYEATALLGQAAIPVMLLSLGAQMCHLRLDGLKVGVICSVQSLTTGAIAFGLIYWFIPLPTMQLQMMVLFTMLPPAVMNYLFAERLNIEPMKVASMVLFGNFFSILTLPILLTYTLSLG